MRPSCFLPKLPNFIFSQLGLDFSCASKNGIAGQSKYLLYLLDRRAALSDRTSAPNIKHDGDGLTRLVGPSDSAV
jgi:hypothetical protein